MKVNVKISLLSLFILLLWACGDEQEPIPDITNLTSPVTLVRYDRELMQLDTGNLTATLAEMEARFPEFTDLYLRRILPLRRSDFSPEEQTLMLKAFLTADLVAEIDTTIRATFPNDELDDYRAAFETALRYYKHYLPDAPRPDTLMAFFSQFELAVALYGKGEIAVGLEMFLGPVYNYQRVDPRDDLFRLPGPDVHPRPPGQQTDATPHPRAGPQAARWPADRRNHLRRETALPTGKGLARNARQHYP
jgi:hypothetical protein